jgi:hypothetical protein
LKGNGIFSLYCGSGCKNAVKVMRVEVYWHCLNALKVPSTKHIWERTICM